jgi:hypothetical protein
VVRAYSVWAWRATRVCQLSHRTQSQSAGRATTGRADAPRLIGIFLIRNPLGPTRYSTPSTHCRRIPMCAPGSIVHVMQGCYITPHPRQVNLLET